MPYCNKCGAEVTEDAQFCPNCGSSLREMRATRPYMERREKGEKGEKEEKTEKHEKGEKGEKGEKAEKGGDRTAPITGGLVLIWLGVIFYLASVNLIGWVDWWAYFLLGLGVILLFRAVLEFASAGRMTAAYGPLIGGAVLVLIGISWVLGIRYWWALILVGVGVAIIVSAVRERVRSPRP